MSLSPKKYIEFKYNFKLIFDEQLETIKSNKYYFILSYLSDLTIHMFQYKININIKDFDSETEVNLETKFDEYITESLVKYFNSCTELMRIIKDYLLKKYNDEYKGKGIDFVEDLKKFVEDLKKTLFGNTYYSDFKDPSELSYYKIEDFKKHLAEKGHYDSFFSGVFSQLESHFKQKIQKFIETHDYGGFNLASGNKSFSVKGKQYNLFSNRMLLPLSNKGTPNDCELANNIVPGNNCNTTNPKNLDSDLTQYKGNNFWWNHWYGMPKPKLGDLFIGIVNENEITMISSKIDNCDFDLQDCRIIYLFEKKISFREKYHCYLITQSVIAKHSSYLSSMALILIDEKFNLKFIVLSFEKLENLKHILSENDKNLCVYNVVLPHNKVDDSDSVELRFFNWFDSNSVTRFSFKFTIPSGSVFNNIFSTNLEEFSKNHYVTINGFKVSFENGCYHLKLQGSINSLEKIKINNDILIGHFLTNNNLLLPITEETLPITEKTCENTTCNKIGTPEGYRRSKYHHIIVKTSEKSCWMENYNEKNTCSKLLFKSLSFSFGTPFIRLTNGKLLGVGHIKMLADSNIYEYKSKYVAKIQSNIKNYMDSLNEYKQHTVNCVIGYNYFSYFILFDETQQTFFISDFFLCSNENNQYKFSLIFTTGIFKIGNDIYISSGDGDYYSNVLVFNESVVLQNCKHDALSSSFAFEQMLFLLFYKRVGESIDVIDFNTLSSSTIDNAEDPPKTCFGRFCSAFSRRGGFKKRNLRKTKKRRKTRKFKHRNNSRSKQ